MSLFQRFSDIVSANVGDLIERFEDPEQMLRLAIREMEAAVEWTMHSTAKTIAGERLLARQLADEQADLARLGRQAHEAVRRGGDDDARKVLVRKRERETIVLALEDQLEAMHQAGRKLRRRLDAMRVRLDDAKRQLVVLTARQRSVDAQRRLLTELGPATADSAGFAKFDRFRERVDRNEAELDALFELAGPIDPDEPADRTDEIEKQLDELKAAARGDT